MKTITIIFAFLLSLTSFAAEVDVLSAEFGVLDQNQNPTLCLTVVRVPASGELIGVVESIEDCYYARKAKKSPTHRMNLNLCELAPISDSTLLDHLQTLDGQLKFLLSEGE